MQVSKHQMEQGLAPEHIPAQDLAQLLAVMENTCGNKDELKRLCKEPALGRVLPADIDQAIDKADLDLSGAVYHVVEMAIASGDLRPLIGALRDFKSDVADPLGKHALRHYLEEQSRSRTSAAHHSK